MNAFGQQPPPAPQDPRNPLPDFVYGNEKKRQELERDLKRGDMEIEETEFDLSIGREASRRKKINHEERKRIELLLRPNPEDMARFGDFLQLPKT